MLRKCRGSTVTDAATSPTRESDPFGEEDSNLHDLGQSQAAYRLTDPREYPAGVEPACPVWKTGAWTARPGAHVSDCWGVFTAEHAESAKKTKRTPNSLSLSGLSLRTRRARRLILFVFPTSGRRASRTPKAVTLDRFRGGCRHRSAGPSDKHSTRDPRASQVALGCVR